MNIQRVKQQIASAIRTREAGNIITLIMIAVVITLFEGKVVQSFLNVGTQQDLWRNIAMISIFAIGETFVIICGGIDLSVGSVIAVSGVMLGYMLAKPGESAEFGLAWPLWAAAPVVLLTTAGIGAIHGYLVGWVKMQPFVATLGSMIFLRSLAMVVSGQMKITITDQTCDFIGNKKVIGIPTPLIIMAAVAAAAIFVMRSTIHGRYIRAVGSNEEAAALSGVRVRRVKMMAYITCSLLAGVAGIVYAGYLRCGDPSAGYTYELFAIAASVIGGCSLLGGQGSIIGTITGLPRVLNVSNPSLYEGIIAGSVIVGAETFNIVRQKRAARVKKARV